MVDRSSSRDVQRNMHRTFRAPHPRAIRSTWCLSIILVLVAHLGCGGGQKKTTTPSSSGSNKNSQTSDPESLSPTEDPNIASTRQGADSPETNSKPDTPDSGSRITPPKLDLSPKERKKQLTARLKEANLALRAKDANAAIYEAKQALTIAPRSVEAVVILAHAYYQKKLDDTAEVVLDLVLRDRARKEQAQRSARLFYVYGLIYDRTNRPDLAMRAYTKATTLNPNLRGALINIGVHQLRNNLFDKAIHTYERLTNSLRVNTAVVWTNLGSAYRGQSASATNSPDRRNSLLRKAELAYKRAISINKKYANSYYNLGLLYLDAKPFPTQNGSLDDLRRLENAKTYFDEYHRLGTADTVLVNKRKKQVTRLIKREKKRRQQKERAKQRNTSKGQKGNDTEQGKDDFDDFDDF